jgi:hypothetical protein
MLMVRRLLAFALAFVVIAVPLAADVCAAACAEHAGHSIDSLLSTPHHHHPDSQPSPHHQSEAASAPVTQRTVFKSLPHRCGRLDAVISESPDVTASHIVSAAATMARFTPLFVHVSPASAMDSRHGPPAPSRPTSPLRI